MGLGIGRRLKKAAKKLGHAATGGIVGRKLLDKMGLPTNPAKAFAEKAGIGVNPKTGKFSLKHFADPAGIFTGQSDALHQKLGIGVRPPKISGLGTDPEGERIAAETKAAQQSALMSTMKRRLRRQSMLSVAGSLKSTKDRPMKLSSVIAQGKMATGE